MWYLTTAANDATILKEASTLFDLHRHPVAFRQHRCGLFFLPTALQTLWGPGEYREEMNEMLVEQAAIEASPPKSPLQLLRDGTVRWQLVTLSIIYFCNQMSGMSAVRVGKSLFTRHCASLCESHGWCLPPLRSPPSPSTSS